MKALRVRPAPHLHVHAGAPRALGAALLFVSLAAACGRKGDADRQGSAPVVVPPASDSLAGRAPAPSVTRAPPGLLPAPVDSLSGDRFHAFVQALTWGGGTERPRRCRDDKACEGVGPSKTTSVRLDAVLGQDSLSARAIPAPGVVVLRAVNRGTLTEARYGLRARAGVEYYLIVQPLPGAASWRLEELVTTAGARAHRAVASGTFRPCNHPFQPARIEKANFHRCDDGHLGDTLQRSSLLWQAPVDPPMWVGCAQGCCVAE